MIEARHLVGDTQINIPVNIEGESATVTVKRLPLYEGATKAHEYHFQFLFKWKDPECTKDKLSLTETMGIALEFMYRSTGTWLLVRGEVTDSFESKDISRWDFIKEEIND